MAHPTGDHYQISVGGGVGGNVVVGRDNQIVTAPPAAPPASAAELAAFAAAFAELKAQLAGVDNHAPTGTASAAATQLDALHAAATAPIPDLGTMQRVRSWFIDHLPAFAGAVTSLVVHPVVGVLVKSSGDAIAAEFRRRFGGLGGAGEGDGS